MPNSLTRDMVATALQRLEALQTNETAPIGDEKLKERAEEVAEAALQAIAICVKYILASFGECTIEGLGTLLLQNGSIMFTPERDLLQYALLKLQDEAGLQRALREVFIKNLALAHSILPMIELAGANNISAPLELVAEEELIKAVFGNEIPNRFDAAASKLLSSIIRELHSAGFTLKLPVELSDSPNYETQADEINRGGHFRATEAEGEVMTATIGKTYLGKVVRLAEFGAFIELFPGVDGLLHISEISEQHIRDIRNELKVGEQVLVKVLAIEGNHIRLSRKALLREARERLHSVGAATQEATAEGTVDTGLEERET